MDSTAIYYHHPLSMIMSGSNGKFYPYQKVIQTIYEVERSEIEARRLKIQKHPERIVYQYAEPENFSFHRGQVALKFHCDRNISICLNGKGKLDTLLKNQKNQEELKRTTLLKLWNEMDVIGMVRTPLDTNDFKKQPQVNVIVHGDAYIRNNGNDPWFPNQRLIVVLPSPILEQNLRFEGLPEHAFYPIVKPFDCEKHTRYVTDLIYDYLIHEDEHDNYPKWIQNMALKQWKLDLKKILIFDQIEMEKEDEKKTMEKRIEFYIGLNKEAFSQPFIAYEKSISMLEEKMIGKVIVPANVGKLGTIVVNNKGISKNATTSSEIKHSFRENTVTSKINKKQNISNVFEENSSDDEL